MIDNDKLTRLMDAFADDDLLEDRSEYSVADFMESYELSEEEVTALYLRIQSLFYGRADG